MVTKPYGTVYAVLKTKEQYDSQRVYKAAEYFRFNQHGANERLKELERNFESYEKKAIKVKQASNIKEVIVVCDKWYLPKFQGLQLYESKGLANGELLKAKNSFEDASILALQVVTNMTKEEQKEINNSPIKKVFKIEIVDDWGGSNILFVRATKKEIRNWLSDHYINSHRQEFDADGRAFLDIDSFHPKARYITAHGNEDESPLILGNKVEIREFDWGDGDVYVVAHVDSWFEEELGTFSSAEEAVVFLQNHMQSKKKDFDLLDEECLEDEDILELQGEVVLEERNDSKLHCRASWFFSARTSYEYDEWGTAAYTCVVKRYEVLDYDENKISKKTE